MATHAEIQVRWQKLIVEYRASGLTKKAFAEQHNVSAQVLGRWNSRFDADGNLLIPPKRSRGLTTVGEPAESPTSQWVALIADDGLSVTTHVNGGTQANGEFTEGRPEDDALVGDVTLRIGNVTVDVRRGFDEKLLADVIRVVSASC